ncbi:MAG: hypothetical protein KDA54_17815 [Phycisphaerales bacterium]|nr:hypothetical protein [Phycisphaerales bacterium]
MEDNPTLSNKQRYYQDLLWHILPTLKNGLSNLCYASWVRRLLPSYRRRAQELYWLAEAIHNMHHSMFEQAYTAHDVHMINYQFRDLWEKDGPFIDRYRNVLGACIRAAVTELSDDLRGGLKWDGPREDEVNYKFEWER